VRSSSHTPIRHLIAAAAGWGLNPDRDATYLNLTPANNDGTGVHRMTVGEVPVDGFWSISVYDAEGHFVDNPQDAYSLNSITAKRDTDGSATIQFGSCDASKISCLPIFPGWNYMPTQAYPHADRRSSGVERDEVGHAELGMAEGDAYASSEFDERRWTRTTPTPSTMQRPRLRSNVERSSVEEPEPPPPVVPQCLASGSPPKRTSRPGNASAAARRRFTSPRPWASSIASRTPPAVAFTPTMFVLKLRRSAGSAGKIHESANRKPFAEHRAGSNVRARTSARSTFAAMA
jgi:hypothetical protein